MWSRKDYKNCTIKLVTTSGWNLTTPVTPTKANETSGTTGTDGTGEVAGTQYHFLGLGDTANLTRVSLCLIRTHLQTTIQYRQQDHCLMHFLQQQHWKI